MYVSVVAIPTALMDSLFDHPVACIDAGRHV